jgi:replication factor A1
MCAHLTKEVQCRMIEVTDTTNRILDLFKQKDIKLSKKKVHDELSDLVNKYGMAQNEAERTIIGKFAKEHNIIIYTASRSNALRDINSLTNPNEWVSIEGKVISASKPETNKIFMKAVFADGTGAISITLWSRKEGEPMLPEVKIGKWYRVSNVVVNSYNNAPVLSTAKNSTIEEIPDKGDTEEIITQVKDLSTGLFNIRGKIIQFFDSKNDKIDQVGLLGDESGIVKFITWKSSKIPTLEKDKSYIFNYAQSQKYNELYSLILSSAIEIPDEIHVPSKQTEIIGNLVSIKSGSGLIRRCKVDGCGRVISRQNYCTIHEIQNDFKWDMRIKGVIDDGITAYNVIMTLPTVEKLSGLTLDKAIEISQNNPLGADEVFMRLRAKLLGRYFIVTGTKYPDRIFVQDCNPLEYEKYKEITGLKPDHAQTSLEV